MRLAFLGAALAMSSLVWAETIRLPGLPAAPKSYAECESVDKQWSRITADINQRHSKCISSQACRDHQRHSRAYKGPCSCELCHDLHDQMVNFPKLRSSQKNTCTQQVRTHLAAQKAWEEQLERMKAQQSAQKPAPVAVAKKPAVPELLARPPAPKPAPLLPAAPATLPADAMTDLQRLGEELSRLSFNDQAARPQPDQVLLAPYGQPGIAGALPAWISADALKHSALASGGTYSRPTTVAGNALTVSSPAGGAGHHRELLARDGFQVDVVEARPHDSFMIAQKMNPDRTHQTIISVEGTENSEGVREQAADWGTNLDPFVQVNPSSGRAVPRGFACVDCVSVHRGFHTLAEAVYNSPEYRQQIALANANPHHRLVFTGHSLGAGATSVLAALTVARHPDLRDRVSVVTYATPGAFYGSNGVAWFNRNVPRAVNFVNHGDLIRGVDYSTLHRGGQSFTFSSSDLPSGGVDQHDMNLYRLQTLRLIKQMEAEAGCLYCPTRVP